MSRSRGPEDGSPEVEDGPALEAARLEVHLELEPEVPRAGLGVVEVGVRVGAGHGRSPLGA